MDFPVDLKYTKDHEWARLEDTNIVTIGITDFAQDSLGDIVYIELPSINDTISREQGFGVVESVKTVSDLYAPVSGRVSDINESLLENPEAISEDPYGEGWLIKVEASDVSELNALMTADEYTKFVDDIE